VAGDLRLLATMVQGTPMAALYRAVVAGSDGTRRAVFDSPVGRVEFDEVADVSARSPGGAATSSCPSRSTCSDCSPSRNR
jgi:hypothetical protein